MGSHFSSGVSRPVHYELVTSMRVLWVAAIEKDLVQEEILSSSCTWYSMCYLYDRSS